MIGVLRRVSTGILGGSARFLVAALAVGAMLAATAPADANPRYAAIVFDANSGQTHFSRYADEHRFPASITKVMTVYILFEELAAGRLQPNSPLTASQNAADQAPSKIGIRAGQTISVEDAIKLLITKSANDVAVVVAENVSGSVSAFADRMTKTARSIGMSRTTFRNPHGLPNSGQVTTARDIVTLALAVQKRFPQYYHYFNTRSASWRGTTFRNHNRLLGQVQGVDGMKTGFIRASGFNLVANMRRDGKHLVAVVMGGRTGASRDAHMREILANALPNAARGAQQLLVSNPPMPQARPNHDPSMPVTTQTASAPILVPSTTVPATLVAASAGRPYPLQEQQALGALVAQVSQDPQFAEFPEEGSATAEPRAAGDYVIQIGAFATEALAKGLARPCPLAGVGRA